MAGKFELYKDKSGEFRFRLKAGNGEVIATSSESYSSKAAALNGIESIQKSAPEAKIDDQTD
ncbi:YegP family protein [Kribbella sp. NPDC050241]|uniref:YegP family protein n=1 Tax=Kribbella sp. NPDC050241 TaxID=3364115 RepID=UPI0037943151